MYFAIPALAWPVTEDGNTSEELIRKADHAMYEIKKKGGAGICFYEEIEAFDSPANNPVLLQKS